MDIQLLIKLAEAEAKTEDENLKKRQQKIARRKASKQKTLAMKKARQHKNLRKRDFWVVSK